MQVLGNYHEICLYFSSTLISFYNYNIGNFFSSPLLLPDENTELHDQKGTQKTGVQRGGLISTRSHSFPGTIFFTIKNV